MARVKRGVTAHARHKKVLKAAKGYYGARSRTYRVAVQAVTKAGQYAYRGRKEKKRGKRNLEIDIYQRNAVRGIQVKVRKCIYTELFAELYHDACIAKKNHISKCKRDTCKV